MFKQAQFVQSATFNHTLPDERQAEIAFCGRSNAGKSSCLNALCAQKSLARTSKTPGRTQLINFFAVGEAYYLVDLPGYGYAKVPESVKLEWQRFLTSYFNHRKTITGLVVIMDVRHPLKDTDWVMLDMAAQCGLSVHCLLNKADKLKFGAAKSTLLKVQQQLKQLPVPVSVQLFSASKKTGLEELNAVLNEWLLNDDHTSS